MAIKFSELPTSAGLDTDDLFAVVEDGTSKQATVAQVQTALQPAVNTVAAAGSTETLVAGHNDVTLSANCTITMPSPASGTRVDMTVTFTQNGTGGWVVTWPGSVTASGSGPMPTISEPPASRTDLRLWTTDGGTTWRVAQEEAAPPILWFRDTFDLVVPTGTWTPVPWETVQSDHGGWHEGNTAATTVTAGSNGAALPDGTINVADTTGFPTPTTADPGYLLIQTNVSPDERTMVRYTGKTGTTFTGCTLGSGTLATSDAVEHANVNFDYRTEGDFFSVMVCLAWENNATGVRSAKWVAYDGTFNFTVFQVDSPGLNTPHTCHHMPPLCGQPGGQGPGIDRVEVYQSSGGALKLTDDGIAAPIVMGYRVSHHSPG